VPGTRRGGDQIIPRPADATEGAPAPWAGLSSELRRPRLSDVRRALADVGPPRPSPREALPDVRSSAVLAPLYEDAGETYVVLTRRTWTLRSHRGEVSFPGGGTEDGETPLDTALREAREEVALDAADVEVVGELDHLSTVSSRSFIVPFVGLLPVRPHLHPNPDEVAAVLHVPLSELLDPAIYHEEQWPLWGGNHSIFFFELAGDTVWGATAAMLRQLLGMVTGTLGRGDLAHE
jgi:8-oxo-dGTP pyrophosphatase MutT (NUDIX family)